MKRDRMRLLLTPLRNGRSMPLITPCARWLSCFFQVDVGDTSLVVLKGSMVGEELITAWQRQMMLPETTILPPLSQLHILKLLSLDLCAEQ